VALSTEAGTETPAPAFTVSRTMLLCQHGAPLKEISPCIHPMVGWLSVASSRRACSHANLSQRSSRIRTSASVFNTFFLQDAFAIKSMDGGGESKVQSVTGYPQRTYRSPLGTCVPAD
jgi:hypothetical protein